MFNEIDISVHLSQWALAGLLLCFILPPIEWRRDWTRRVFIFAVGPACWLIFGVHLFLEWLAFKVVEKETGFKKEDWTEEK